MRIDCFIAMINREPILIKFTFEMNFIDANKKTKLASFS